MIKFELKSDFKGVGKNNMGVTKTGIHYPKPAFVAWRQSIIKQLPKSYPRITTADYLWHFSYTPADKRRRDITAILDGLFHCFERANIVKDDSLIKNVIFLTNKRSKTKAGMVIRIFDTPNWRVACDKLEDNLCPF